MSTHPSETDAAASKPDTRDKLIAAGLHLFGHKGFSGTSTRALAARAETNIASITYHFGGKDGLRMACAHAVADRIGSAVDAQNPATPCPSPDAAVARIEQTLAAIVNLLVGTPEAEDIVGFVIRELTDPGAVADTLYAEFLDPRHRAICALWAQATGRDAEDDEVKLAAFALLGQILYFRIAQPFVMRRMSWKKVDKSAVDDVTALVCTSLRDTIERHRV